MLKKTITYENPFTEQEVTEEHYFHISKGDIVQMELEVHNNKYTSKDGQELTGLQAKMQRIVDAEDGKAIIAEIKDLIHRAYGRKEGDRFIKSEEVWQEFASSEAFSQLLFELCTDAEAAAAFASGCIPKNLAAEAQRIAQQSADISDAEEATVTQLPVQPQESQGGSASNGESPRLLTEAEIREMDATELQAGLADGRYKLS